MKTCTKDNCDRQHRARGLCSSHYNQEHAPNRHSKKIVACAFCGTEVMKNSGSSKTRRPVCSNECRQWLTTPYCALPADHWARWYGKSTPFNPHKRLVAVMSIEERGRSQRTSLRAAIEDGASGDAVIAALMAESTKDHNGCWISKRIGKDGYPIYQMALKTGKTKSVRLHRIALEAKLGKSLGTQAAHHMCANSSCINPDHLQPISFRENTAEMMQRNYYIARIKQLEEALALVSPTHPALQEVSLPVAS